MPQLPEVETIRLQLEQKIKGLRITGIEVLTKKSFMGEERDLKGLRVLGVERRGKITIIELEKGVSLAIHLKLTGQLIYREEDKGEYCEQKDGPFAVCELPNKFTRVIISFDPPSSRQPAGLRRASKLYFNDLRIFGWVRVVGDIGEVGGEKLGPEANDEKSFSFEYFKNILSKTKKPVKLVIMDQEKLAGVGNIYANEALFAAGIVPTRKANELSEDDIKILRNSILKVLQEAIKHKGSSDRDEAYRQITGEKGTHQNYLQVYGRAGQECPRCGGIIKRIALGGRGTFYCGNCQK